MVASVEAFIDAAPAEPDVDRHPGRLLRAEEGDGGRRRARRPGRPRQHRSRTPSRSPRGCGSTTSLDDRWPKKTDFSAEQYEKVLDDPRALGPARLRRGQPGGLPVPGDLRLRPRGRRRRRCSARWSTAGSRPPTTPTSRRAAEELGYTPARADDRRQPGRGRGAATRTCGKVARVIYNRLETRRRRPTGCSRSTRPSTTRSTSELGVGPDDRGPRRSTRRTTPTCDAGLPPGPIEAPGDAAIEAAANPAEGDWFYYVTVNLRTGETKFAETYDEFLTVQGRAAATTATTESRGRLLSDAPCGAPSWVTRSPTRCRRCCTGRGTPRSGSTGSYDAVPGRRGRAGRRSWPGSTTTGAGCR